MNKIIWVAQICFQLSVGGIYKYIMDLYKNIDRNKIQFAFIVQRKYKLQYDDDIIKMGGKVFYVSNLNEGVKHYQEDIDMILKEHKEIKIVHCHMNYYNYFPLKIAKKNGISVRISHTHTCRDSNSFKAKMKYNFFGKMIKHYATDCFSCSVQAGKDLYKKDFNVLVNTIDTLNFQYDRYKRDYYRKKMGLDGKIVLGHVSNFSKIKNIPYLIDVLNKINVNNMYVLLLVGDGVEFDHIKGLSDGKSVFFTGLVDNVADYMNSMDIFLMPSLYEGFGITAVEAQASGLKTICSDKVPKDVDCTDLINHLSLNSVDDWCNEILKYVDNEQLRFQYNSIIREKGFDIRESAKRMQMFYLCSLKEYERDK